jgi:hypothetical protein
LGSCLAREPLGEVSHNLALRHLPQKAELDDRIGFVSGVEGQGCDLIGEPGGDRDSVLTRCKCHPLFEAVVDRSHLGV